MRTEVAATITISTTAIMPSRTGIWRPRFGIWAKNEILSSLA
jgi:hypothetical protein